ncbi:MAG: hypothetical protein ACYDBO_02150 [Vulcanimicrobiaceae bacterium]
MSILLIVVVVVALLWGIARGVFGETRCRSCRHLLRKHENPIPSKENHCTLCACTGQARAA